MPSGSSYNIQYILEQDINNPIKTTGAESCLNTETICTSVHPPLPHPNIFLLAHHHLKHSINITIKEAFLKHPSTKIYRNIHRQYLQSNTRFSLSLLYLPQHTQAVFIDQHTFLSFSPISTATYTGSIYRATHVSLFLSCAYHHKFDRAC